MLTIFGEAAAACDGVSRRKLLQAAGPGLLGMSLPRLWAAEEQVESLAPRAKSVIFLFLFGGPSQLESFDLKPEAPSKIRGPFSPIASQTPGLLISECLPRLAAVSNLYTVIRTMSHSFNDHSGGAHYIQSGKRWHIPIGGGFDATPQDHPSMGSVVEYLAQKSLAQTPAELASYMVVPNRLGRLEQQGQYLRPGEYAGWLGRPYNPLTTKIDKRSLKDNPYWRDCTDEELTFQIDGVRPPEGLRLDRISRRSSLLDQFESQRKTLDTTKRLVDYDRLQERALGLITSEKTRVALDLGRESVATRERYGRHLFGQSALMARRLVESGVRFVTVHYETIDGYGWDSHVHSDDVKNHLMPTFDQAAAALLEDLDQRGLLDETLVVAMGEMGRTPQANSRWGRGHWSTLFPALIAGAGVRRGTVYGRSDKDAAYPLEGMVSPEDLAATIYHALGISPDLRLPDAFGRPVPIVDGGIPVLDLWS